MIMNTEIALNMSTYYKIDFFQSLVNVVPLALFENVEFISLSTKRVLQRNAFSIWVVLHFKASQIFYFPFLQQLFAKIRQNHHKHHRRPLHIIFEKETK